HTEIEFLAGKTVRSDGNVFVRYSVKTLQIRLHLRGQCDQMPILPFTKMQLFQPKQLTMQRVQPPPQSLPEAGGEAAAAARFDPGAMHRVDRLHPAHWTYASMGAHHVELVVLQQSRAGLKKRNRPCKPRPGAGSNADVFDFEGRILLPLACEDADAVAFSRQVTRVLKDDALDSAATVASGK